MVLNLKMSERETKKEENKRERKIVKK